MGRRAARPARADALDLKGQGESLRREFEAVRQLYEERFRAIGQRIQELEAAQAGGVSSTPVPSASAVSPPTPPSPQHLSALIRSMRETRVRAILVETWYLADTARAVARDAGAQVLVLPQTPGAVRGTEDYISHLEHLVTRIAEALR